MLNRLLRRWQLRALARIDSGALVRAGGARLVGAFRRVSARVPAYADLLRERGVDPRRVRTLADVLAHCPILEKQDLFGRFPIHRLCMDGTLDPLANVLTSSGQGGRFAFGLSNAAQGRRATRAIELGLEYAFQTDRYRTLLINALPMGVRFSCSTVTVAETSVREDMVVALMCEIAPYYDQTILALDPLFCKRLLDYGRDTGLDWGRSKVHVILGEETFGECFRRYVADRLGQDPCDWSGGFVGSSMGVGELGLNLFFETLETVRLRQLAHRHPEILSDALGPWPGRTPPLLFVYDPRRIYVEIGDQDDAGFGALTLSTLDPTLILPLLRYRTGDQAKLLDSRGLTECLRASGYTDLSLPPLPMIAVAGRMRDRLPDGRTLLDFKDALYARSEVADLLSGAFRIDDTGANAHIDVQMRQGAEVSEVVLARQLRDLLPASTTPEDDILRVWSYADFPFGKRLDYERKFAYYAGKTAERAQDQLATTRSL